MKLQFKEQDFQVQAVKAVVGCFEGQPLKTNRFTLERSKELIRKAKQAALGLGVLDFEVERSATLEEFGGTMTHALERMSVNCVPESDEPDVVVLKLSNKALIHLRHPADRETRTEWQLRLDELEPALERCLERWGSLPSCLTPPTPSANAQPASAPWN